LAPPISNDLNNPNFDELDEMPKIENENAEKNYEARYGTNLQQQNQVQNNWDLIGSYKIDFKICELNVNRCRLIWCQLILFSLVITSLVLTAVARGSYDQTEYLYFKNIIESWKNSPITKFTECQGKQNEVNMLKGNIWMGTVKGCNCKTYLTVMIANNCGKNNGCRAVGEKLPVEYMTWRGKQICTERMQDNYLDFDIQADASSCPSGKKSCGIIDSEKNYLCLENNKECPVNKIEIIKTDPNNLNMNNKIVMGDYNLFYSNDNILNSIPIDLKISEDIPCKNPYFYNSPNPVYILDYYRDRQYCFGFIDDMKNFTQTNNTIPGYQDEKIIDKNLLKYDNSYTKIDTFSEKQLLLDNKIYNDFLNLPYLKPEYYEGNTLLFQKSYFGLKTSCLKDIKTKNLKEKIYSDFESIENHLNDTNILLASLIIFIISACLHCIYNIFEFVFDEEKQSFYVRSRLAIFALVPLAIGFLIPSILVGFGTKGNKTLDQLFTNANCVDDYTIQLYDRFIIGNQNLGTITMIPAIFSIILLVSEIILSIVLCNGYKKLYE
jgi:hypothetical protein